MNYITKPLLVTLTILLIGVFFSYTFIQNFQQEEITLGGEVGYDLTKPTRSTELPDILLEVSGLTDLDDRTVAAVQDEDGVIFIFDLESEKIIREIKFDKDGDYEGITRAGNDLYVLRSDGKLFEILNYTDDDPEVEEYDTDVPVKNNEGLAYDAKNNRLLLAGKSEPKGKKHEDERTVYAFDLKDKKTSKKPVFTFKKKDVEKFIEENKPEKSNFKVKLNPSAIAVHPTTDRLYVLSSRDNLLYIY